VGGQALERLYYFVSLEASSGDSQAVNRITNPLIADANSIAVLPSRCGAPATSVQCAAAEKFIQSQMNVIVPRSQKTFTGLARADYHWTDRNSFSLVADAQHYRSPNGADQLAVSAEGGLLGGNGNVARRRATRMPAGRRNWDRIWSTNCASGGIRTASRCCPNPTVAFHRQSGADGSRGKSGREPKRAGHRAQ